MGELIALIMILAAGPSVAGPNTAGAAATKQETGFQNAVLVLSGASCMEDLDEETVELFTQRRANPLDLNAASLARLNASGLLSRYQCASIIDYRQHNGDILSFAELALVDGIGERVAEALRLFVTLQTNVAPAQRATPRSRHSLMTRASAKIAGAQPNYCGGLKYSGEISNFLEIKYSNRTTYDDGTIKPGTFGVTYYGKRWLENAIIGDYNLRYGQGLLQWSGTTMTGVSTAAAMKKSGSGVSPTGSFSGGRRGAAASVNLGRGWGVSAALSLPGVRELTDGVASSAAAASTAAPIGVSPIAHASYICSHAALGATAFFEFLPGWTAAGASIDWNVGAPNLNFYGEVAWCRTFALIAGISWVPDYGQKYGLSIRYYPTDYYGANAAALRSSSKVADEHAVSAAATLKWLNATLDYVYHPSTQSAQLKSLLQLTPEFTAGEFKITPALRYTNRVKSTQDCRHDLRGDITLNWRTLYAAARYNAVFYNDFAWLWYAEAAYRNNFSITARWTLFKIDKWDDRIYCYERDNPGNYTNTAFYGRGYQIYLLASYRIQTQKHRHDLGLKASFKSYPWNLTPKSRTLEFKLQYSIVF